MNKLWFRLCLLLSATCMAAMLKLGPALQPARAAEVGLDTQQHLLAATLRIRLLGPVCSPACGYTASGGDLRDSSMGLGTLVRDVRQVFIITHDHWDLPFDQLVGVTFGTADGRTITQISAEEFFSLLRYRDGGTLILQAPDALQDAPALELTTELVPIGARVDAVYRDRTTDTLHIIPMTVEEAVTVSGRPAWQLRSVNREVIAHGNSGGGVFINGRLVGNMWTTIYLRYHIPLGVGELVQQFDTRLSTAAQLPSEAFAMAMH